MAGKGGALMQLLGMIYGGDTVQGNSAFGTTDATEIDPTGYDPMNPDGRYSSDSNFDPNATSNTKTIGTRLVVNPQYNPDITSPAYAANNPLEASPTVQQPLTGQQAKDYTKYGGQLIDKPITGLSAYFNPQAANEAAAANANAMQGRNAFSIAQPAIATSVGRLTPQQGAILSGGNPTAATLYGMQTDAANQTLGIPAKGAYANAQQLDTTGRKYGAFNKLNGPETEAQADVSGDYNRALSNTLEKGNIGTSAALRGATLDYDLNAQNNLLAQQPTIIDTTNKDIDTSNVDATGRNISAPNDAASRINDAQVRAGLSANRANMIPSIVGTQNAGIRNDYVNATHPAPMGNTYYRDDSGNLVRNPLGMSPMQTSMANIQDPNFMKPKVGGSSSSIGPSVGGRVIVNDPSILQTSGASNGGGGAAAMATPAPTANTSISPTIAQPISGSNTNNPSAFSNSPLMQELAPLLKYLSRVQSGGN